MLVLSGCTTGGSGHDMSAMSASPPLQATSSVSGTQAKQHNDADVTFTQGMIPHHRQAIAMADMVLGKQAIYPRVISLAQAIKTAQGPEIDQMQGWLNGWGMPASPAETGMPSMPGHDMGAAGEGMMTEQDLAALRDAQGVDASKLFLTQMVEHHNGAIAMAQNEIDGGQFTQAVTLARSIIDTQRAEVRTMQEIVNSL
ncbi:DUF305 domain-containing protein [Mycolicibacterium fortuitum]|nr:DUF305 domain-containing protein [Mycolicibacterium fortuitum]OFB40497.1 DUF305 domain-containing protein [Mycolicibacterium sp. (ex Dasyatis americana)]UBV18557.1 DUF305 domain-containing protein [Mycolicibacterium fortuitum]